MEGLESGLVHETGWVFTVLQRVRSNQPIGKDVEPYSADEGQIRARGGQWRRFSVQ